MNELITSSGGLVERTPNLIAVEINNIKEQTRKMVLYNSIEIGRRLVEAKEMLSHGEWGDWLEKSVDYSKSTANNLMRIFEEYGSQQITFFGDNAKSQALGNLSYTQAVALLGVPEEEREIFIKEHDIDNMSTRELQKAIKEREQALKEKEDALKKLENANKLADKKAEEARKLLEEKQKAEADRDALQKEKEESKKQVEELQASIIETKNQLAEAQRAGDMFEVNRLQSSLQETESELANSKKIIEDLERQLQEKPIEVSVTETIEKIPEETERELNELREKVKLLESSQPTGEETLKFKFQFEALVKDFQSLLGTLEQIKGTEVHDKYKGAVKGLIEKMSERL